MPFDTAKEQSLPLTLTEKLAFSVHKLEELVTLHDALSHPLPVSGEQGRSTLFEGNVDEPKSLVLLDSQNPVYAHQSSFSERRKTQQDKRQLPLPPTTTTTTIGSFPQTTEIRQGRAAFKQKS